MIDYALVRLSSSYSGSYATSKMDVPLQTRSNTEARKRKYCWLWLWQYRRHFVVFSVFHFSLFTTRRYAEHGIATACRPTVRPSVRLVDRGHIGWHNWKIIS